MVYKEQCNVNKRHNFYYNVLAESIENENLLAYIVIGNIVAYMLCLKDIIICKIILR